MNLSDPFKTPPRYQVSQEGREKNTHAGETQLQVTLEQWCHRDFYSQGGEEFIPLWLTPLTHSQLGERCQKTREIFRFNTENLSYESLVTIPPC